MIAISKYNKQHPLRVFEAFAGYGSQSLAFKYLKDKHPEFDFKVVGYSEIEPSAIQAYGHYPVIHRLVALAFLPNPQNLPLINHKDENRHNNRLENLEWCDSSYNIRYSLRRRKYGRKKIIKPNEVLIIKRL